MLIGSLVELHVGLHSCLCFSQFEKLVLKVGSTPPRYLAVCRPSSAFSYRNLDNFLILGGSIEKAPASSIALRHLVDRSSFCSWNWFFVARYLPNTSVVDDHFLDTSLDSFLDTSWYLSCRALLKVLFKPPLWSFSHFFDLSRSVCNCSSPKHFLFHSQPFSQVFFKLFQVFLHLVSF